MSSTADCPQCHCKMAVQDDQLGKRLRCPKCGTAFTFAAAGTAPPVRAKKQEPGTGGQGPGVGTRLQGSATRSQKKEVEKPARKPPAGDVFAVKKRPHAEVEMAPEEFISAALELPSQRPPMAGEDQDREPEGMQAGQTGGQDYALSQILGLVSLVLAGMGYVLVSIAQGIVLYLGLTGLVIAGIGIYLGKKRNTPIKQAVMGAVVCAGVIATALILQYYMQQQLGAIGGLMNLLKGGGGGLNLDGLDQLLK